MRHFRGALPLAVRLRTNQWKRKQSLRECKPSAGDDGDYAAALNAFIET
jgi:hypothetical protein